MPAPTKNDVIALLLEDHRVITRHIEQLLQAPQERREELFFTLTQRVIAHEAAEELVIYPALRQLPGGAEIADARIAEQAAGEKALRAIDRLHPTSSDFSIDVRAAVAQIQSHADHEERTVFPLLKSMSAEQLSSLGEKYTQAKATAPTHPHPHIPHNELSNKLLGPLVARFDRARDRLRHPERRAMRPGASRKSADS